MEFHLTLPWPTEIRYLELAILPDAQIMTFHGLLPGLFQMDFSYDIIYCIVLRKCKKAKYFDWAAIMAFITRIWNRI